ncbi:hypothetical protein DB346_19475 [Verrucomicrobia bacterium LW23]|nr:hypothetical protein DB346_19475 [Verrucomicrobia bacterium LW23]
MDALTPVVCRTLTIQFVPSRRLRAAFSLVELILVLALISILVTLSIPLMHNITRGNSLTRAGQTVGDQLALARQEAAGRNRPVQVRFIKFPTGATGYRGMQLWAPSPTNITVFAPISRIAILPEGVVLARTSQLSPLLTSASVVDKSETFPGIGPVTYCAFRFRPGGSTDLAFSSVNNFVTVVYAKDEAAETPPANYFAVQVDPVNGRTRLFQP